ncbi:MAG: hypothetical protein JXR05_02465 [Flavobacteriaceae bacterium]
MISTVRATFNVISVSQKEFPDIHGGLNKANAFRHALWNVFIAIECSKFSKNVEAVLKWAKDFTDWHEEFSPNEELARVMDLHNNLIGRELYRKAVNRDKNHWITLMKEELVNAVLIASVDAVDKYPNQLVYLEN